MPRLKTIGLSVAALLITVAGMAVVVWGVYHAFVDTYTAHEIALVLMLGGAAIVTADFPLKFGQGDVFLTIDGIPMLLAAFFVSRGDAVLIAAVISLWAVRRQLFSGTRRERLLCAMDPLTSALAMYAVTGLIQVLSVGSGQPVEMLHALAAAVTFEVVILSLLIVQVELGDPGLAREFLRSMRVPSFANITLATIGVIALASYMDTPLLAMLLLSGLLLMTYFGLWIANSQQLEKKRSSYMQETFSRYIPETLVGQHLDQMQKVQLGGEQREISVLFCDIRGFTSWSERREAAEIVAELNTLLTELSSAVMGTEGTLDKFTGDGLMAFWGAPFPQSDHPERACRAALSMVQRLDRFNEERVARGQTAFAIGIGVHTGLAVVGNVGHEKRLDYTAIGDTVNLTARLEAATKDIGSVLLVSSVTIARLPMEMRARSMRIGEISVKGREQQVEVYALQPWRPQLDGIGDPDEMIA